MADTFDSRLKLRLQESGGNSGQWGDLLNQTITNVASVFGFGTHQLTADSDATLTLADDGASLDALKSSYLKITSSVSLTATRVLTFSPNTFNQVKYVENNTTGGQSITLSQGSGANITIENGATKIVYFDGAGSGAAVVDALAKIDFDNAAEFTTLKVTNIQANDGTASMTLSNSTGNINSTADIVLTKTGTDDAGIKLATANANRYISSDENGVIAIGTGTTLMGGTQYLTIDGGNVGIGETDNSGYLSPDLVVVAKAQNGGITVKSSSTSHAGTLAFADAASGTATYDGFIQYEHNNRALTFAAANSEGLRLSGATELIVNDASVDYDFRVESDSNTHALFVQGSDGNVGISAIPSGEAAAAHVIRLGDRVCIAEYDDGSNPEQFNLFHNSDSSETYIETGLASVIQQRAGVISFKTAASGSADAAITFIEAMRMDASGGVTINNGQDANINFIAKAGSSSNALQVDGSSGAVTINEASADADFRVESDIGTHALGVDAGNDCVFVGTTDSSTDAIMQVGGNAANFSIKMENNYGAGTALYINNTSSTSWIAARFLTADTLVGFISVSTTATSYSQSGSDERLKENIQDWDENVLESFKNLKPKTFNFIADKEKKNQKGYIAQDLVDSFPEAYPLEPKTDRYHFNPSGMVVYLMKAIQEQQEQIEELKTEIAKLKGE